MGWGNGILLFFGVPMMSIGETFAIIFGVPAIGVVAIPFALIWTHHRRKMEELKMQRQRNLTQDVQAQFDALRAEIRDLRDTTMQYDLSFDTALHRVESRLAQLERPEITHTTDTPQQNTLYGGR